MINPDNKIDSRRNEPVKGSEKSEKDKPEGIVNRQKFKEVYGVYEKKKSKEELAEEWEDVNKRRTGNAEKDSEHKVNKPVSLFDLAKDSNKEGGGDEKEGFGKALAKEISPEKIASSKKPKGGGLFDLASPKNVEKYSQEIPDLSQVGALSQPKIVASSVENKEILPPERADSTRLQKIIDQIVEHVYQLETKGETSTVITIGSEKSVFKGASIKISELDTSRGQLNITIDNLRPDAKALIERHEAVLFDALEKKGYQVQQFIATSSIETPRIDVSQSDARHSREKQDDQKGEQQQGQKRQRQPDEEET